MPEALLSLPTWQRRVRWLMIAVQAAVLVAERAEGAPRLGLAAVLVGLLIAVDLLWAARRSVDSRLVYVVDLTFLTAMTLSWGEAHGPLHVFFLVQVALAASCVPRREAIGAAALAMVLQGGAYLAPALRRPDGELVHDVTHMASATLASAVVGAVLLGLAEGARAQARALREAEATRELAGRLAAIGRLAAGVAHELATPLGSIELLSEEIADELRNDASRNAVATLRGEVRRCRAIIDRLVVRGEPVPGSTSDAASQLRRWIAAWVAGHDDRLRLLVDPTCEGLAVRGAEDGWRGAVWTVLDNARRASAEPIDVSLAAQSNGLVIRVDDRGPGVDDDALAKVGEPFWSHWKNQRGAGLGLYVARTFARGTGGDVHLERRAGGGVRAILSLPFEEIR